MGTGITDQEFIVLSRLESDLHNGGFIQFFCNWGFSTYQAAVDILQKIGAQQCHSILCAQYDVIRHLENDPVIMTLWDIPQHLSNQESSMLTVLDQEFWSHCNELTNLGSSLMHLNTERSSKERFD